MDQKKIQELQMLEQNLQGFLMQKQNFQAQLAEAENAQEELKKSKNQVFKIIGGTMIETNKEDLEKELKEKIELLNLRIKNIDKQEVQIREKAQKAQEEMLKSMQKPK